MDRRSEKEKSTRKFRDERDSHKDTHHHHHHHHNNKDRDREREREKHRSKDHRSEEHESGGEDDYDHRKHHRDAADGAQHRSFTSRHSRNDKPRYDDDEAEDRYRRSRSHSQDRELRREYDEHRVSEERDLRRERAGSRDRPYGRDSKRGVSVEREGSRERSQEPYHSHKRKDRGEEVQVDGSDKRAKVSYDVKGDKKVRSRFEEQLDGDVRDSSEGLGKEDRSEANSRKEEKREKRKFEDREAEEKKSVIGQEEVSNGRKRERRKFEDWDGDNAAASGMGGSNANGGVMESSGSTLVNVGPNYPPSKVSSISTTNENKGVSITGSHEVTGKSSTDGTTTAAGKSGNLSLDALARAKKILQKQKELAEKLKNNPKLNKSVGSISDSKGQTSLKEELKLPTGANLLATASVSANTPGSTSASGSLSSIPAGAATLLPGMDAAKIEAVRRAHEVAAKMGFQHDSQFGPLINLFPGQMPQEAAVVPKPAKAPVLRLDALGREIDEHGNVINVPINNLRTLKVNINKEKKDSFQILKPELEVDPETNPHFDPRMGINKNKILRPKRMSFQFVEEGRWSKDAEIIKLKNQFGEAQAKELKAKQAQLAKAKAEPNINPNLIEIGERVPTKEKPKEIIPEVEWWDVPILRSGGYGDIADNGAVEEEQIKTEKITIYIEHPKPIEPPAEPAPPPPQPLKLTKKEQKKLRTQRRLAREKERQEMIRQGLIEPPKPKVKMSNLMKVLGSEATQDPTRLEMEIRTAAAEREQAHIDRNIARKLTPAEKREKKERKLFEDPNTLETIVSIYKVNDLSHPQNRFKVDVNAQENRLTGCAVIFEGFSVVVVEGGSKSIKRYGKLMLRRINWAAKLPNEEEDDDEDEDKPPNKCSLVWQGSVAKPSFNRFWVHECRTEAAARKVFADAGVGHYWDLASNFTDDQF